MRLFVWGLMVACALVIGCDKPTETIPSISPSSGTTDSDDHGDHDHDGSGHTHADGEDHDHDDE